MKKNLIILSTFLVSGFAFAQVGINNDFPKATLDVTAKSTTGNLATDKAEGFIAPRLTGDQMKSKDALYLTEQTGAIVYATVAVTGTPAGKTINVTSPGYYYYDHANLIWQKVANPVSGTDTTNDAWINGSGQVLLGTLANGTTARPDNAAFRIADNGSTVIGSTQSAGIYKLQIINSDGPSLLGVTAYGAASNGVNKPFIDMIAIGGTEASPANINAGTQAGVLEYKGRIGGSQQQLSSITSVYTGDGTTNKAKLYLASAGSNVANQVILSDDGNVGIGIASPTSKLHVISTNSASDPLRLEGVRNSTVPSDKALVVDAAGVVKIGVTSQSRFIGSISTDYAAPGVTTTINKIIAQSEIVDNGGEYNPANGFFTPLVSGTYLYEYSLTVATPTAPAPNTGISPANDQNTSGLQRGVAGFVAAITNQWVGRQNFSVQQDARSIFGKGYANLVAGQSYYFGISTNQNSTIIANPTGASGSGIGTYFNITRIQ